MKMIVEISSIQNAIIASE
jgi:hypothetical protein